MHKTSIAEEFAWFAGSVVGGEHLRCYRNNQDGLAVSCNNNVLVAVVTDGCSSGKCNEVGAKLAALWLSQRIPQQAAALEEQEIPLFVEKLTKELLQFLKSNLDALCLGEDAAAEVLHHFFLFTFLVALVTRQWRHFSF